jgi:Cof subfamily protein (haloacid dehalogenase superfamily)
VRTLRLVATDLDGTLLRPDGSVSERTRAALAAVQERGLRVVLVTGRPVRTARLIAAEVRVDDLLICSNGAIVYDVAREAVVAHRPIAPESARDLIAVLRAALPGVCFGFELGLRWACERGWSALSAVEESHGDDALLLCDEPVTKVVVRHPRASVDELLAAVQALGRDDVLATQSGAPFVELSAAGVDKARALAELCRGLGIAPAEVVAFGDMPNDLPMLAWAGHGVAVADGHPRLLAAADEVTASSSQDGVAVWLERLVSAAGSNDQPGDDAGPGPSASRREDRPG